MRAFFVLLLGVLCSVSGHSLGADVVMAFSHKIPPYTFPDSNNGVEIDVAREALAFRGHRLIPRYYPLDRVPLAFRHGRVDATMRDLSQDLTGLGAHYADPAVVYDDVLITLSERNIRINKPEDLANYLVIAYISAGKRYHEWIKYADQRGLYFERVDQELHAQGLFNGHFDVMLADRYIFRYMAKKLEREQGLVLKPVDEHPFDNLEPVYYRPAFRDPNIRDDFNAGLKHLKETGRFEQIYERYLQGLGPEVLPQK